jgi:hypothetical protein
MQKFEQFNDKYFREMSQACQAMVDVKVALCKHDQVLDAKISDFNGRVANIDSVMDGMRQENAKIEQ